MLKYHSPFICIMIQPIFRHKNAQLNHVLRMISVDLILININLLNYIVSALEGMAHTIQT